MEQGVPKCLMVFLKIAAKQYSWCLKTLEGGGQKAFDNGKEKDTSGTFMSSNDLVTHQTHKNG